MFCIHNLRVKFYEKIMAKLLVRDKKTGLTRQMTDKSFEIAGKKRGFEIIGRVEEPKSEMEQLKDKLRAEKAAKEAAAQETETVDSAETIITDAPPERKKPGPKPKKQAE